MNSVPESWPLHEAPLHILQTFKNMKVFKTEKGTYEIRTDTQERLNTYTLNKMLKKKK